MPPSSASVEKAMNMWSIIGNTMQMLDPKTDQRTLVNCMLVNKTWNNEALRVLWSTVSEISKDEGPTLRQLYKIPTKLRRQIYANQIKQIGRQNWDSDEFSRYLFLRPTKRDRIDFRSKALSRQQQTQFPLLTRATMYGDMSIHHPAEVSIRHILQPHLKVLRICMDTFTEQALSSIATNCPHLEDISLRLDSPAIPPGYNEAAFSRMLRLLKLKHIQMRMSYVNQGSNGRSTFVSAAVDHGCLMAIAQCKSLVSLHLECLKWPEEYATELGISPLYNIRKLHLKGDQDAITKFLSIGFPFLTELYLEAWDRPWNIDTALKLPLHCPLLKKFELKPYCSYAPYECFSKELLLAIAEACPKLIEFDLFANVRQSDLDNEALVAFLDKVRFMEILRLRISNSNCTIDVFETITEICASRPLQELRVTSDEGEWYVLKRHDGSPEYYLRVSSQKG